MNWRQKICIVGLVFSLLIGWTSQAQATSPSEVRSLAGIVGVRILIEDFNLAMQKTGLQKGQLYAIVEQALQKNDFKVVKPEEPGKVPLVYVRLSSVIPGGDENAPISFYLNVHIKQPAILAYGQSTATPTGSESLTTPPLIVTTWERGMMAVVDRRELLFYIQNILTNAIGDLATDRQAAGKLESGI